MVIGGKISFFSRMVGYYITKRYGRAGIEEYFIF